jgi:sigma-B regulation protein RsbU (phosphoserine phosphatase)
LLLRRDGSPQLLSAHGMALGVVPEITMKSHTIKFLAGDTLLLYTDGVTEAMNEDFDEFGIGRLEQAALKNRQRPAKLIARSITKAIRTHAGDTPQFDDITLVVVKREDGGL